jgi:hypothetical protein
LLVQSVRFHHTEWVVRVDVYNMVSHSRSLPVLRTQCR